MRSFPASGEISSNISHISPAFMTNAASDWNIADIWQVTIKYWQSNSRHSSKVPEWRENGGKMRSLISSVSLGRLDCTDCIWLESVANLRLLTNQLIRFRDFCLMICLNCFLQDQTTANSFVSCLYFIYRTWKFPNCMVEQSNCFCDVFAGKNPGNKSNFLDSLRFRRRCNFHPCWKARGK